MAEYSTKSEMIAVAIAGGITQGQIDSLLRAFPFMEKESWWISNASSGPVRAIKYRLEVLDRNNRKQAEEAMNVKRQFCSRFELIIGIAGIAFVVGFLSGMIFMRLCH